MTNNTVSVWSVLEKILKVLDFQPSDLKEVKFDLQRITQIETFNSLLVEMPFDQRKVFEQKTAGKSGDALVQEMRSFLSTLYSDQVIQEKSVVIAQKVLQDYFQDVLSKVKSPEKKQQIVEIMNEVVG